MMLRSRQALVFAATGAIGSEVARTFAREGARVWLSGRNPVALDGLASEITESGGLASTDVVDATDPEAVAAYVDRVAREAGRIDAVFNGIGGRPEHLGYPARSTEQGLDAFLRPLRVILGSTFLTSREVARHMVRQGSGSIVTLSATLSGVTAGNMAGISATCGAIEAMTRSLSGEFGPRGVRVNCVRGDAMIETRTIRETSAAQARIAGIHHDESQLDAMARGPLGRPLRVAETAAVVAFLASDASSGMTSQVVSVSGHALHG